MVLMTKLYFYHGSERLLYAYLGRHEAVCDPGSRRAVEEQGMTSSNLTAISTIAMLVGHREPS